MQYTITRMWNFAFASGPALKKVADERLPTGRALTSSYSRM
jgi:hypothetical protein